METRVDRDRRRHLPAVDVRARDRPDRLHVQPVPHRRRAAVAVPHRAASDVPAGERGDRVDHSRSNAALDHLRPRRVRRVRFDEPVPRGRAQRRGRARRHGLHGVARTTCADRPPVPLADGQVLDLGDASPAAHRHAARAPRLGGPRALRRDDQHASRAATCSRTWATPGRSRPTTSSAPRRRPKTCSAPRASRRAPRRRSGGWPSSRRPRIAVMHGSSFTGDGAAALHALADDYEARLTATPAGL